MRKLTERLTPRRAAWLMDLRDRGPALSHSVVGYACRKLGWSEWDYRVDGRQISAEEAHERRLTGLPVDNSWDERITPLGRAKLSEIKRP